MPHQLWHLARTGSPSKHVSTNTRFHLDPEHAAFLGLIPSFCLLKLKSLVSTLILLSFGTLDPNCLGFCWLNLFVPTVLPTWFIPLPHVDCGKTSQLISVCWAFPTLSSQINSPCRCKTDNIILKPPSYSHPFHNKAEALAHKTHGHYTLAHWYLSLRSLQYSPLHKVLVLQGLWDIHGTHSLCLLPSASFLHCLLGLSPRKWYLGEALVEGMRSQLDERDIESSANWKELLKLRACPRREALSFQHLGSQRAKLRHMAGSIFFPLMAISGPPGGPRKGQKWLLARWWRNENNSFVKRVGD